VGASVWACGIYSPFKVTIIKIQRAYLRRLPVMRAQETDGVLLKDAHTR
jgi:hypothetical protein